MQPDTENLVPKVHPATRQIELEDPLELMAQPVPGDPEIMIDCIVQEFAGMGFDLDGLMRLFHSPMYPVLNQLLEHFGEETVRRRVEYTLGQCGVFRTREIMAEDLEEYEDEPEFVELSLSRLWDHKNPNS